MTESETSLKIFHQMVAAVQFAHGQDVIHRDLKPANVLLDRSNEVKIADFGIAKRPDRENTLELTRPEMALGTPSYTAPEQVRDASSVDHRADVFSLGCMLFELVCGERAFGNRNMMERLMDMAQGHYPDPDALVTDLEPGVVKAIHGALVAEPDLRIPDCATLLEVLAGEREFPVEGKTLRPVMSGEETQEAMPVLSREPPPPEPEEVEDVEEVVSSPQAGSSRGVRTLGVLAMGALLAGGALFAGGALLALGLFLLRLL